VKQLIKFFGDAVVGVTSGFDRIVFEGMIRPLMYAESAMGFFDRPGRVNDFETQPTRIYCRSSFESPPSSGGLIQTADGTTGGVGLPMTKRSGFAA